MLAVAHQQIPLQTFEAIVARTRSALKTLGRDGYIPIRGRDIIAALALIIADDLVREMGVERGEAARAAAYIADAGEWWGDITTGARAVLAKRHGTPSPKATPPTVLLAIVYEARQPKPVVQIGSLDAIYSVLEQGDRFRAVSVTDAWATLVERAAVAQIDLKPYVTALPRKRKHPRAVRDQRH